ncbi:hypothetical protein SCLCIDRAFT_1206578 [Scleroderma citrinum Foug A]|uniref:Cofilin n=1 Tax=Scleroderma citrinum Foug A TaxID=1036808 RepID=A0A0C3AZM1_9AGAM|nr:hypothetical protein SCLCIDRAFT_1206578 [Scleroderma citrinum Foug A]
MASGVGLHSDCLPAYQKLKGPTRKHKYIIYTLNSNNTEIIVDKTSAETDYDGFLKDLPEDQCRWAVYDLEFEKDGAKRNKICFISWAPDNAKIKQKMVFTASLSALRRSLEGIGTDVQATDYDEVSYASVLEKASRLKS